MTGLLDGWQNRTSCRIRCQTTGTEGGARIDELNGIPLSMILAGTVTKAVLIRSEDGAGLMLPLSDVADTYLVRKGDIWVIVPARDTNRRRWLKSPVSFQTI